MMSLLPYSFKQKVTFTKWFLINLYFIVIKYALAFHPLFVIYFWLFEKMISIPKTIRFVELNFFFWKNIGVSTFRKKINR